jgi:cyanophycin synthetase
VAEIRDIPLTHDGRATLNLDNILAATAALYAYGVSIDDIRRGLETFRPDPEMLPGRCNLLRCGELDVLLDYAHNAATFGHLGRFVGCFDQPRIGVLDAPGDRSDEEIRGLGTLAASTYSELHLYQDPDRRGRAPGEIPTLLREGALAGGLDQERVHVHGGPDEAWSAALEQAAPGTLVVILTERGEEALHFLDRAGARPRS